MLKLLLRFKIAFLPYNGSKLAQALKSAPSKSEVPKETQAFGLNIFSSAILCMATSILSIEAKIGILNYKNH